MSNDPPPAPQAGEIAASVDLGSNSFHMVIARIDLPHVDILDRLKESVRLASGLGKGGRLQGETQERALACLRRFGQRLVTVPPGHIRVVGTNTLRIARRANPAFMELANEALGHPIEVIAGREEARLIYLGVAHGISDGGSRRLVVDIGGGSTELILGTGFSLEHADSLSMGCVSYSRRFFSDGKISPRRMEQAVLAARAELHGAAHRYGRGTWERCIGSSGTINAVDKILRANGWSRDGITAEGLGKLRSAITEVRRLDDLSLPGLKENRRPVIAGGVAVLTAVFESIGIFSMTPSQWALREGAIVDLAGRLRDEDVREVTVARFSERFGVDVEQGRRVEATARALFEQVKEELKVDIEASRRLLSWAARLHEVGMALSFSGYHRHGAYLLSNADMAGFSTDEQHRLAALVRCHRRRIRPEAFEELSPYGRHVVTRLVPLLRLAVLVNRTRAREVRPPLKLASESPRLTLTFPEGYLEERALTRADLRSEAEALVELGVLFHFV